MTPEERADAERRLADLERRAGQTDAQRYTRARVIELLTTAARTEHDFAGWLADVLAHVAADLGSTEALVAGRPGSWEAADVLHLVQGTVGSDDEDLARYRRT